MVERRLGRRNIIAEDLGYMTDGVRRLLNICGYPGMKILQFGFDGGGDTFDSEYLPHNYPRKSVAYTGTHDNPTLMEWAEGLTESERRKLRRYLGDMDESSYGICRCMIRAAMQSPSELCIIPIQDYLLIGKEGRMNTPASSEGNWSWRMRREDISEELSAHIREISEVYGRSQTNRDIR